ncbi:hypothetical protein LCGC14_0600800 [marine sediment metagenome]|uniref:Uncharacterized protein n=1 Tax=marine sediment metagenome TaxID=412755 RepID=A0A0F9RFA7_9ZZZZ
MTYKHGVLQPPCEVSIDKHHHFVSGPRMTKAHKSSGYVCKDCQQPQMEKNKPKE